MIRAILGFLILLLTFNTCNTTKVPQVSKEEREIIGENSYLLRIKGERVLIISGILGEKEWKDVLAYVVCNKVDSIFYSRYNKNVKEYRQQAETLSRKLRECKETLEHYKANPTMIKGLVVGERD